MKRLLTLAMLIALPLVSLHAQERIAGGNLANETSWTALQNLITKAQGTADTATITANGAMTKALKIETCGKLGKVYAPGVSGRDLSNDCLSAGLLDKIVACGDKKMVFDKSASGDGCVSAAASCKLDVVQSGTIHVGGSSGQVVAAGCPAGYKVTGGSSGSGMGSDYCSKLVCN